MEPGETKNTNSESKPAEKDIEKKRNPEACKWNPRGAISSAVPDLGAGSSTAEAPRIVLSKERTSREGFSQLEPKRTGAGQGGTLKAVSDGTGTPRAGSSEFGTHRGNPQGSRALRPMRPIFP